VIKNILISSKEKNSRKFKRNTLCLLSETLLKRKRILIYVYKL